MTKKSFFERLTGATVEETEEESTIIKHKDLSISEPERFEPKEKKKSKITTNANKIKKAQDSVERNQDKAFEEVLEKVEEKKEVEEPKVEPKIDEKTQEEKDLERYEALLLELQALRITRLSDLENLIANTKTK